MSECCRILTPQEQQIADEHAGKTADRTGRERVYRILDSFQGTKPQIDIERGLYFTESMKQTEGELLTLRWAKAMMHIAKNITVYIDDDTLIVGRGGKKGRYGLIYPELDGNMMDVVIHDLSDRVESGFDLSDEEMRIIVEEICPYWKDKAFWDDLYKARSDV